MSADKLAHALRDIADRHYLSLSLSEQASLVIAAEALAAHQAQQAEPEYECATSEEHAAVNASLGLASLPTIRVSSTTYALLEKFAALDGKVVQAIVREILESAMTAQSVPQPAHVQGWQLVPVEPTDAMAIAATGAALKHLPHVRPLNGTDVWAAMLAAAPQQGDKT